MSDALPLPARPNIEQYKKIAKDLQQACKSGDATAIRGWAAHWIETLHRLQELVISPEVQSGIHRTAGRVAHQWRELQKSNEQAAKCTLAGAQYFVARAHGFTSWPKFASYIEGLTSANSPVSNFEMAADAIVSGDDATLRKLLAANPELAKARSPREHRSTLLHYVSANGVEDFRQKTPKNIVEIAKILLDFGADVNAESDAYGGRSTTLGLTATSYHPEAAGVQLDLMELLLEYGATVDGPDAGVNGCLHNGRGRAAELLAERGARLDLEGAAGVGRLDAVRTFFDDTGSLKRPATLKQLKDGFAWACEFGRTNVVDFLLRRGMTVDTRLPHDGQSGLHWAAYGGHVDTVNLLLRHGASVEFKDESYGGTPLGWALYQWGNSPAASEHESTYAVVAQLARAGAILDTEWFEEDDDERRRTIRKLRSDSRMLAALRGETLE